MGGAARPRDQPGWRAGPAAGCQLGSAAVASHRRCTARRVLRRDPGVSDSCAAPADWAGGGRRWRRCRALLRGPEGEPAPRESQPRALLGVQTAGFVLSAEGRCEVLEAVGPWVLTSALVNGCGVCAGGSRAPQLVAGLTLRFAGNLGEVIYLLCALFLL